jgi:hypothetical protein
MAGVPHGNRSYLPTTRKKNPKLLFARSTACRLRSDGIGVKSTPTRKKDAAKAGSKTGGKAKNALRSDTREKNRRVKKWSGPGSNRRHLHFQCSALPTELPNQMRHRIEDVKARPMRLSIRSSRFNCDRLSFSKIARNISIEKQRNSTILHPYSRQVAAPAVRI